MLPSDDASYGFDNIGDVLSLPPVLFERYLQAAEKVMSAAILNDHTPRPKRVTVDLLTMEGGPKNGSTPTSRKVDERELCIGRTLQTRFGADRAGVGQRMAIARQHQVVAVVDCHADGAVEIGSAAASRISRGFVHDDGCVR